MPDLIHSALRPAVLTLLLTASAAALLFHPLRATSQGCIGLCLNCEICNEWITIEGGTAGFAGTCSAYGQQRPEVLDSVCAVVASEELVCEEAQQLCAEAAGGGSGGAEPRQSKDCRPKQGPYTSKDSAIEAALEALADCPRRCKVEMCGNVVLALGDGQYYINVAKPGTGDWCQPLDPEGRSYGGSSVATYHSHPNEKKDPQILGSGTQEEFSDFRAKDGKKGDKASAVYRETESHLLTPKGVHKKFDPFGKRGEEKEDPRVEVVEKKIKGFKRCK